MDTKQKPTPDTLGSLVEWDIPFRVTEEGDVVQLMGENIPHYTYVDSDADVPGTVIVKGGRLTPIAGFSQQYGYQGACMHSSEQLDGGLAKNILENPGVYILTEVEVEFCDDCKDWSDPDAPGSWCATLGHEPAGWAVLRLNES